MVAPALADRSEPTNRYAVEKGGLFSGIKNACPTGNRGKCDGPGLAAHLPRLMKKADVEERP